MKHAFCLFATLTIIAVAGIGHANAQVLSPSRFDIPFDFTISGKTMPSGSYTVDWSSLPSSGLLKIRLGYISRPNSTIKASIAAQELIFYRSVDGYSLRNVWSNGLEKGGEVPMTKKERRLQRELASKGTRIERVVVAAKK